MNRWENTPPTPRNWIQWSFPPRLRGTQGEFSGFTLIELLVALSIIATVSIVAYVSYAGHMKTAYNATRISAIDSLHLSLSDYYQLKKVLPEPNSNYVSYDERGTYMHSLSGSYGVSGYVSNNFLPAGYVNFGATDPESNQFYAYGKLTDHTSFDVASVLYDEVTGAYKTYLRGTYPKQRLASLIRSYSSSNFVSQNSTEDLPYNPYERKVTAYVSSFSGTITLTGGIGDITRTSTLALPTTFTGELNAGDTIIIATGSTALLHISDGSELSLGSTESQTILALTSLAYNDDNNLASQVALYLKSGEVWTEAPHLRSETDSESDFSIQTDSALAAVRGTVFGVSRSSTGVTAISLKVGKLQVEKIDTEKRAIPFGTLNGFTASATGFVLSPIIPGYSNQKSYMIVPDGEQPIKLDGITNITATPTSTGTLNPFEIEAKIQHPPFSLGYRPKAERISFTRNGITNTGTLSVTFHNPGADSYELYFGTGITDPSESLPIPDPHAYVTGSLSSNNGPVTIEKRFPYSTITPSPSRVYALRVCFHGQCSAPYIQNLVGNHFSYDHFQVWGEPKEKCTTPGTSPFPPYGCQPENLVAYAPYDESGDVTLYFKNNESTGATSAGVSSGNTTPLPADIQLAYPSNYAYHMGSSFVQVSSGGIETKGIFIDSGTTSPWDSLQYNLSSLGLGDNFSIEMSVRGGALKRETGYYYLLWLSDWGSIFNINSLWFGLNNGVFWINAGSSYTSSQLATNPEIRTYVTDPNEFYKVRINIDKNANTARLFINDNPLWFLSINWYDSINFSSVSSINTGWANHNLYQWNDIIDFVKIYEN